DAGAEARPLVGTELAGNGHGDIAGEAVLKLEEAGWRYRVAAGPDLKSLPRIHQPHRHDLRRLGIPQAALQQVIDAQRPAKCLGRLRPVESGRCPRSLHAEVAELGEA